MFRRLLAVSPRLFAFSLLLLLVFSQSVLLAQAAVVTKAPVNPNGGVNVRGNLAYNSNSAPAKMISDGNGGAYMVWKEQRDGMNQDVNIYAQHFNSDGAALWTEGGVFVTTIYTGAFSGGIMFPDWDPDSVRDEDNNLIIVWTANRYGSITNQEFYAQKLDFNTGNLLWSNSRVVSGSHGHTYIDADPIPLEVTAADQYLLVSLTFESTDGNATVDNVLWDGSALTEICSDVGSNSGGDRFAHVAVYGLANPDQVSSNVTFSVTGETEVNVSADVLTNVDAADPIANFSCIDGGAGGGPSGTGIDSVSDNSTLNDQAIVSTLSWGEAIQASDVQTLRERVVANYSPRPSTELMYLAPFDFHVGFSYTAPTDADGTTVFNWGLNTNYASARNWSMATVVFNLSSPGPLSEGVQVFNPINSNAASNMQITRGIDGYGVAVLAFNTDTSVVEGQRLNTNGQKQWSSGGSPLQLVTEVNLGDWTVTSDYLGYYIVAQRDEPGTAALRAYRLGEDGLPNDPISQGEINGVLVDEVVGGTASFPFVIAIPDDGGGMTIAYDKLGELYGQRIYAPGNLGTAWLIDSTFNGERAIIKRDTSSTAANTWYMGWYKTDTQVAAQRYSFDTNASVWGADINVMTVTDHNSLIEMEEDGDNGIFIIASDTSATNHLVQGIRTDGTLLWDSTVTLDLDQGTGRPTMARLSSGNVGAVWEETRSGESNLFFFQRLTSLFQIRNLTGLLAETTSGTNITFGSGNGVNDANQVVRVVDTGNDYPVSAVTVDLTADRSWSSVEGDVDTVTKKSYILNLTAAPGAAATHTLYVPYTTGDESVVICPNATSLADVSTSCTGAITKVEADSDTSIETIDGKQVWAITGLTGTGGISVEGDGAPPADTPADGSVSFQSANGTTNSGAPTLTFRKSTTTTGGVSSYNVTLDPGRNRSFSVTGIPANGNGSAEYVWRDDEDVRVVFRNENDSDPNNDEISVYFKKLGSEGLTQGKHTWKVEITNTSNQIKAQETEFQVDQTAPTTPSLNLIGLGTPENNGTYGMDTSNRMPIITGTIRDEYVGSTRQNSNGSQDTFDKVASGPKQAKLVIRKLQTGQTPLDSNRLLSDYSTSVVTDLQGYQDESNVAKTAQFSIQAPTPLLDGWYLIEIYVQDNVGNETLTRSFWISYNMLSLVAPGSTQTGDDTEFAPPTIPSSETASDSADLTADTASSSGRGGSDKETSAAVESGLSQIPGFGALSEQLRAAIVGIITPLAAMTEPLIAGVQTSAPYAATAAEGAVAAGILLTAAAAAGSITSSVSVASAAGQSSSWWQIFERVLQAMGFFAQHAPQGIVFGTKQFNPVPFALLTITRQAKPGETPVIETVVTDTKGVYQGIRLAQGTYTLAAAHQDYSFPSRQTRPPYQTMQDFYKGEAFTVKSDKEEQLLVVPLDPRAIAMTTAGGHWWQAVATRLSFTRIALPLAVFSAVIAVIHPSMINIAIVILNSSLLAWKNRGVLTPPRVKGQVLTPSGAPIAGAVVRLGRAAANELVSIAMTDKNGRFKLFAPADVYQLNVVRAGYVPVGSNGMSFEQIDTRSEAQSKTITMQNATTMMGPII